MYMCIHVYIYIYRVLPTSRVKKKPHKRTLFTLKRATQKKIQKRGTRIAAHNVSEI